MISPHPALAQAAELPAPPLILIIPGALGEAPTLRALAEAIEETREALNLKTQTHRLISDRTAADGDEIGHAYARGQLAGIDLAQEQLVEEICGRFAIWDQLDGGRLLLGAALAPPPAYPAIPQGTAPRLDAARPALPLPDENGGTLGRLVEELYTRRLQLAALAVTFHQQAHAWKRDGEIDLYAEYRGRALASAMAADIVEQALASAFELSKTQFAAFLSLHGTIQELFT